jgi:hypothetical protein
VDVSREITKPSAPREWCILDSEYENHRRVYSFEPKGPEEYIHVIEKSVYEAAVKERDALKAQLEVLSTSHYELHNSAHRWVTRAIEAEKQLAELQAQAEMLAEALKSLNIQAIVNGQPGQKQVAECITEALSRFTAWKEGKK